MPSMTQIGRRLPPYAAHLGYRAMVAVATVPQVARYSRERVRYRSLPGAERLRLLDSFPKLADRLPTSPFDAHYLYQDTWAAQRIAERRPAHHVDIASRIELPCFLTALLPVTYVDIRPLEATIEGLESVAASILDLPFQDRSLSSVSCLHVTEHIGLGRYGDQLDPLGSKKAMTELQRVVAPDGDLYFSLPVGRPRVCFNAHRIHDPREIPELFSELELVEFASVDDRQVFRRHTKPDSMSGERYACGIYHFRRRSDDASAIEEHPA